jgi:hypothetical protein
MNRKERKQLDKTRREQAKQVRRMMGAFRRESKK